MKPDPRIYAISLRRLNVSPHEAVFVDDLLPNIEAARRLGLHTVHVCLPVSLLHPTNLPHSPLGSRSIL